MSKWITVVSAGNRLSDGSRRTGQERDLVATVEVGAFTMFHSAGLLVDAVPAEVDVTSRPDRRTSRTASHHRERLSRARTPGPGSREQVTVFVMAEAENSESTA